MSATDQPTFYQKLELLLKLPPGSLQGSEELKNLAGWDSLTILEFMVMADTSYNVNLQPGDIVSCQTVSDLEKLTVPK